MCAKYVNIMHRKNVFDKSMSIHCIQYPPKVQRQLFALSKLIDVYCFLTYIKEKTALDIDENGENEIEILVTVEAPKHHT